MGLMKDLAAAYKMSWPAGILQGLFEQFHKIWCFDKTPKDLASVIVSNSYLEAPDLFNSKSIGKISLAVFSLIVAIDKFKDDSSAKKFFIICLSQVLSDVMLKPYAYDLSSSDEEILGLALSVLSAESKNFDEFLTDGSFVHDAFPCSKSGDNVEIGEGDSLMGGDKSAIESSCSSGVLSKDAPVVSGFKSNNIFDGVEVSGLTVHDSPLERRGSGGYEKKSSSAKKSNEIPVGLVFPCSFLTICLVVLYYSIFGDGYFRGNSISKSVQELNGEAAALDKLSPGSAKLDSYKEESVGDKSKLTVDNLVSARSHSSTVNEEERPPFGNGRVLKKKQITYCLAEAIRVEGAKSTLNQRDVSQVRQFNEAVFDFNGRCGYYRYKVGEFDSLRNAVEKRRQELMEEGRGRFTGNPSIGLEKKPKVIKRASREMVKDIQRLLNRLGYKAGYEDGLIGKSTRAAIIEFQKEKGMPATGVANEELLSALKLSI